MNHFGLYIVITRPVLPYARIAEDAVRLGVKMLQLREKHLNDRELLRVAREIRSITRNTGTSFVINDRPDLAVLCEADYLHIGQDDLDIQEVRKIASGIKIGLSTHSIEQAGKALELHPDYISFGPVYSTNAKEKPDPPVGTLQLRQVLSFANVPVVAIGGIFPENLHEVLQSGARNIAMIRYLMQSENFFERAKFIIQQINQFEYENTNTKSA